MTLFCNLFIERPSYYLVSCHILYFTLPVGVCGKLQGGSVML